MDVKNYLAIRLVAIESQLSVLHLRTHLAGGIPESRQIIHRALEIIASESGFIGLEMTRVAAERFLAKSDTTSGNEDRNASDELTQRFHDEIQGMAFFFVSKEKMDIYQKLNQFGDIVAQKYPTANYEAAEAGKCLATGRYTAAVFHLMRVLEAALKSVSKALEIPDQSKANNWGYILRDIEGRMQEKTKANPPDVEWMEQKEFFQNAYAYFQGVRNLWRNPTMHFDCNYDEEGAVDVFNAVSALMRHLAIRLSE